LTPADVHHGRAEPRIAARAAVLTAAHTAHSERFPAGQPHSAARPWRSGSIRPRSRYSRADVIGRPRPARLLMPRPSAPGTWGHQDAAIAEVCSPGVLGRAHVLWTNAPF